MTESKQRPSFLRRLLKQVCPYWNRCGLYQNYGTCNHPTAQGGYCGKYRELKVEKMLPKLRRSLERIEVAEENGSEEDLVDALTHLTGISNDVFDEVDKE